MRFGHISKQGNRLLRFLLIEAGRSAVRPEGDPDRRRFYYQLALKRNGSIAAVAWRELLLRLFRYSETRLITKSSGAEVETRDVPEVKASSVRGG